MAFVVGCSKKTPDGGAVGTSSLSFTLPGVLGNGSLAGFACYAVNISAADIPSTPQDSCGESWGSFAGLANPGSTISLQAKKGDARKIQLYYILSETACQQNFDPELGLGQNFGSNKVFLLGEVVEDFVEAEETVYLPIQYPSNSNSLATVLQLSQASNPGCFKADTPIDLAEYKPVSVVLGAGHGQTAAGTRYSIRIKDQKIELDNPPSFNNRILPARLGEE